MLGRRVRGDCEPDSLVGEAKAEVDILPVQEVALVEPVDAEECSSGDEQARPRQRSWAAAPSRRRLAEPEGAADAELAGQQDPRREVGAGLDSRFATRIAAAEAGGDDHVVPGVPQ
jgi:hypothetical protein